MSKISVDKTLLTVKQLLDEVAVNTGDDHVKKLEKTVRTRFCQCCDLLSHACSDSNSTEKTLTSLHSEIIKYMKCEGANQVFLDALCKALVRLLFEMEWDSRFVKKVVKSIVSLELMCPAAVSDELSSTSYTWKKENLDIVSVSKWSTLLVSCKSCQSLLSTNLASCLGPNGTQGKLNELMTLENPTVAEQALAQILIKMNLQCFQLLQNVLDPSWWLPNSNATVHEEQSDSTAEIIQCLLHILKNQDLGNECTFLAGTAVAFFLSLNPELHMRACSIVDVFSWIRNHERKVIGKGLILEVNSKQSDSTLAEIAFLSGVVACAKEEILCEKPHDSTSLALWLFNNITIHCYGIQQFPAFQLLLQWFNKVSVTGSKDKCSSIHPMSNSQVVKDTMSLVWTHLDSPVDGVNQLVIQVFNILISCLKPVEESNRKKQDSSCGDFNVVNDPCQSLIKDVLSQTAHMSWHVKGKHRITAAILPMIPLEEFFLANADLFSHLLECMGTNYLSPCATDMFRAIVQTLVSQNEHLEDRSRTFMKLCASPILLGITNNNSSIRQNVNMFWLPLTLKIFPTSYELLLKKIKEVQAHDDLGLNLQASIAVYKCARNQQIISSVPLAELYRALSHPDDKLRMDAFSLICITSKKSEPLATWELEALEKFLPLNMNMDNAPFRQQLHACLRHVLVRARDSSLAHLRSMKYKEGSIENVPEGLLPTLKFIQAVWNVSLYSLHLAASFQRLKTSLDWMTVILDTLTYQPERHQKKGNTPGTVLQLLSFGRHFQLLNFCNEESSYILVACIFHGTDEIREMAAELLLHYFPWPLPLATDDATIASITQTGVEFSLSPKPYESEAGALIIKLIFHKYVLDHSYSVKMCLGDSTPKLAVAKQGSGEEAVLHFMSQLTSLLGVCISSARYNILVAAQSKPAHGIVLAIRRCLSECDIHITPTEDWCSFFAQLRCQLIDLLDLGLYVLGGRLHGEATAPSFEQMGMSIQAAVMESLSEQPNSDDPVLSANYQIIGTWCWVNIKEVSMLLYQLVEMAVVHPSGQIVLKYEEIEELGSLYFRILTQCRHRGAIEACNAGFIKYCSKLLFSSVKELTSIPRSILDKVVDQVKGCDSTASITRRSAGLPLIVQSIVTAESKTKKNSLLKYAVETLIEVVACPVEENPDENRDIPQVHALNILKAVFRESSVAVENMQYLGTAAVTTVKCFSSPYWAVRNGAIQLFETLLQRMLGQKRTREDALTFQTVQEFFTHFPNMQGFVMEQMRQAGFQHQRAGLQLHPSLFPILTILAKLTAGPSQLSESVSELRTVVASMKNSPILAIREMSAQAIVPLVPRNDVPNVIQETLDGIPSDPSYNCNFNEIHGSLLHIRKLLQSLQEGRSMDGTKDAFLEKCWLVESENNSCALVRLAYAKTITTFYDKLQVPLTEEIVLSLEKEAEHIVGVGNFSKKVLPGIDQWIRFLVDWWLANSSEEHFTTRIGLCLTNEDNEVKHAGLSFLLKKISAKSISSHSDWKKVLDIMIDLVCKDCPPQKVLCDTLKLMMVIHEKEGISLTKPQRELLWPALMSFIKREVNSQASAWSIGLSAVLAKENLRDDGDWESLDSWTKLLLECSNSLKADVVRQQTAVALTIASPQIAECGTSWGVDKKGRILWNLYSSTCHLLMDEQMDIREQAAKVKLCFNDQNNFKPLHPNLAIQNLVQGFVVESHTLNQLFILRKTLEKEGIADLKGAIKDDSNILVNDLFEPEDVNPYLENHVVMRLELENLQKLELTSDCSAFCDQVRDCVKLLKDAFPLLEKLCAGPLNVTCHKATFRCLWNSFHALHVALLYRPPSQLHDNSKQIVKTYSQLHHLHPVLKRKLHQILEI